MQTPKIEGNFETLEALEPTLRPILAQDMATRFLPWMDANHKAWAAGKKQTHLTMNGDVFQQKTFKYQATTLDELRRKFSTVADNHPLTTLLKDTGCLAALKAA